MPDRYDLKFHLDQIKDTIDKLLEETDTCEYDDYFIDIYEKLEVLFNAVLEIKGR